MGVFTSHGSLRPRERVIYDSGWYCIACVQATRNQWRDRNCNYMLRYTRKHEKEGRPNNQPEAETTGLAVSVSWRTRSNGEKKESYPSRSSQVSHCTDCIVLPVPYKDPIRPRYHKKFSFEYVGVKTLAMGDREISRIHFRLQFGSHLKGRRGVELPQLSCMI